MNIRTVSKPIKSNDFPVENAYQPISLYPLLISIVFLILMMTPIFPEILFPVFGFGCIFYAYAFVSIFFSSFFTENKLYIHFGDCIDKESHCDYPFYDDAQRKNYKDSYNGSFKNSLRNGNGKYCFSNGDSYVGEWKDDKMNGYGYYLWMDGDSYKGNFKNNNIDGLGVYTFKSGDSQNGVWVKGRLKLDLKE